MARFYGECFPTDILRLLLLAFGQEAIAPPRSGAADATVLSNVAHSNAPIVKVLRTYPLAGTVDGKAMFASLFEVTFAPGDSSAPHYHPGEVVGYVAEGTLEFKITGKPLKTLKAGGTFFEPAMIRHEVARNPDAKQRCRVIFTLVHPRNVKRLTIPAVEIDAQQAVRSDKLNSAAARIWFLASFRCLQRSSNPAASSQCLMKNSSRLMKADRRILGSKTDKQ